jgi:hypothetical protein
MIQLVVKPIDEEGNRRIRTKAAVDGGISPRMARYLSVRL